MSGSNTSWSSIIDDLFRGLHRYLRRHRLVLSIAVVAYIVIFNFGQAGLIAILATAAAVTLVLLRRSDLRLRFQNRYRNTRLKYQIRTALERHFELAPRILALVKKASTILVTLQLQAGQTVDDVAVITEHLAVELGMSQARVTRSIHNASIVTLSLIQGAPLSGKILYWQDRPSEATSLWDPIPIGIDETGEGITISLPYSNVIAGGEPGAGKSVFLARILAQIVRDPESTLFVFDGKPPELSNWATLAAGHVETDIDAAIEQIDLICDLMNARYQQLATLGIKKVRPETGMGLVVVVIDEMPYYVASGKQGKVFAEKVRDLTARGRAAGIVVILTAQKPTADTVPTSIRDLISLRIAFRCSSVDASNVILGSGWAGDGYSASTIPLSDRGIGYLLGDLGIPQLFRSYFITPEQEAAVIAFAQARILEAGESNA